MQPRRTMPKKFSTWYSQRAAPPFAPFEGWAPPQIESFDVRLGRHAVHTPSRNPICTTISLTSLPHLRDNHYIAPAQCSHLFITPLFQRFYLYLFLIQDFPKNFSPILLIAIDHRGRGGAL